MLIQREVCEVFAGFGDMRKTKRLLWYSHMHIFWYKASAISWIYSEVFPLVFLLKMPFLFRK